MGKHSAYPRLLLTEVYLQPWIYSAIFCAALEADTSLREITERLFKVSLSQRHKQMGKIGFASHFVGQGILVKPREISLFAQSSGVNSHHLLVMKYAMGQMIARYVTKEWGQRGGEQDLPEFLLYLAFPNPTTPR